MTFALALFGLAVAALFDWFVIFAANIYRLDTGRQRWLAFVAAFAIHGPFAAIGISLLLTGLAQAWLIQLGMGPGLAFFAVLWVVMAVAAAAIWLVSLVPYVRKAKAEIDPILKASTRRSNGDWAQRLGLTRRQGRS